MTFRCSRHLRLRRVVSQRVLTLSLSGASSGGGARGELLAHDPKGDSQGPPFGVHETDWRLTGVFHCDPHPGNIMLNDDGRWRSWTSAWSAASTPGRKDKDDPVLAGCLRSGSAERVATPIDMIQQPPTLDQHSFTQDICALVSRYHDMSGGASDWVRRSSTYSAGLQQTRAGAV